ncbi:MAG: TCP-1/cpn60 chaperonin family protein, partial [Candidatus Bathyarchaeia archaeon]
GVNVLLCQKGIDDMAQHFLARAGILAARRLKKSDMEALAKATGAKIVTNIDALSEADTGYAELVEERKIGDDKMIFVEGCKDPKAVSILIRGGSERIVDEAERSIHDALSVVRDVVLEPKIVAGGGAPEIEAARAVRRFAETLTGKERLAVMAFADALEVIPAALAENTGMDPINILSEMKSRHEKGEVWAGFDPFRREVASMDLINVYEPLRVKSQVIKSASEAASMLLKIDEVVAAAKMKPPKTPPGEEGGPPE